MQLEDIRERLLHEENTQVRNARDYYESVKSKNESKEIQDGAYNLLLLAVADIDEKRRVFNDARTIKALAPILESKITIREGSNLEKDLSGDYIRRAGDYEKRNAGSVKIPGEYASIETSTKERKELFEKIRNEIRKRNRQNNRMGQGRLNQGGFFNAKRVSRGQCPSVSIIHNHDNNHKRGGKTPESVCPLIFYPIKIFRRSTALSRGQFLFNAALRSSAARFAAKFLSIVAVSRRSPSSIFNMTFPFSLLTVILGSISPPPLRVPLPYF